MTDQVIVDHLLGRYVVGIYPLLKDETCWFLAVDFDKGSWQDDVSAFLQTCRDLNVPASVERSRSGDGGHVWIFFESPVPASSARNMGCYLITETMKSRPERRASVQSNETSSNCHVVSLLYPPVCPEATIYSSTLNVE